MRLRITKNAMGGYEPFSLRFIDVPSAIFFFINLVLNYLEQSNTHFINTHSPSSQRYLLGVSVFGVMLVNNFAMASPTVVRNATLVLMFNVV